MSAAGKGPGQLALHTPATLALVERLSCGVLLKHPQVKSARRPALSPSSRLPGQLADLCARLGISGHGIAAPPTGDLPEPWLSLLTYCRRGKPERAPVPGWAVMAIELPDLDGARVTVLGLHNGEQGQFLHLLASGVTPEYTWPYGTIANRMPVLWLRDRNGRWHTARPARSAPLRDTDDFMLWLRVVPPLDHGTPWIDVVAAGQSAEVRARLPLRLTASSSLRSMAQLGYALAHRRGTCYET
ncbi:MAG: hypothetical protein ACLQB1_27315 [Streptosporangiaceae bacterium]